MVGKVLQNMRIDTFPKQSMGDLLMVCSHEAIISLALEA